MRADKSDMGKPSTRSQLLHPFMTSLSDLVAQREQEIYQRFEAQLAEKDEIIAEKVRLLLAFNKVGVVAIALYSVACWFRVEYTCEVV